MIKIYIFYAILRISLIPISNMLQWHKNKKSIKHDIIRKSNMKLQKKYKLNRIGTHKIDLKKKHNSHFIGSSLRIWIIAYVNVRDDGTVHVNEVHHTHFV